MMPKDFDIFFCMNCCWLGKTCNGAIYHKVNYDNCEQFGLYRPIVKVIDVIDLPNRCERFLNIKIKVVNK
jgi:hypothetical protein